MTVSGDAILHTLTGDVFVSDLVDKKDPTYVYTWDGERVTVGQVTVSGPIIQVPLRIQLDDDTELFIADGGRVVRRDKDTIYVRELADGTSLMPLYLKPDRDGYPTYREPDGWNKGALTRRDGWNWRRVSRMVAESVLKRRCAPGDIVRHIDGNRRNCNPENLRIEVRQPKAQKQKASFAEPIFEALKIIGKLNHKVETVTLDFSREMFFIKGVETSNAAIGGIFVLTDPE